MAADRLPKPKVVLSQLWIEIFHRNLARRLISTFLITKSLNLNSEVDFGLHGRHDEKSI